MRHYKNTSDGHLTIGIPGTGRLRRMEMHEELPLCKEENKHIQGLVQEGKLEFIKDDDHDAIAKIIRKDLMRAFVEEFSDQIVDRVFDKVMEKLGAINPVDPAIEEATAAVVVEEIIKLTEEMLEDHVDESMDEEGDAPLCATCGNSVWPTPEGICPVCSTDFNNPHIYPNLGPETLDPETNADEEPEAPKAFDFYKHHVETPELDPVDPEPVDDEDLAAPVVETPELDPFSETPEVPVDEESDEFGPLRGTDAWKELTKGEKSAITRKRKAAAKEE